MFNKALSRKVSFWVIGTVASLVSALLVLWLGAWNPATSRTAYLHAVADLLFNRPDPIMELSSQNIDKHPEELRTILEQARAELNYQEYWEKAAPYCTEKGLELSSKIDNGLALSCVGFGMKSDVQSVSIGEKDPNDYRKFTVIVSYGLPGETQESFTFEGTVCFNRQGLIDYLYVPYRYISEFSYRTHDAFTLAQNLPQKSESIGR